MPVANGRLAIDMFKPSQLKSLVKIINRLI